MGVALSRQVEGSSSFQAGMEETLLGVFLLCVRRCLVQTADTQSVIFLCHVTLSALFLNPLGNQRMFIFI